jgi:hypothetical protein
MNWTEAKAALKAGHFVRQAHWPEDIIWTETDRNLFEFYNVPQPTPFEKTGIRRVVLTEQHKQATNWEIWKNESK